MATRLEPDPNRPQNFSTPRSNRPPRYWGATPFGFDSIAGPTALPSAAPGIVFLRERNDDRFPIHAATGRSQTIATRGRPRRGGGRGRARRRRPFPAGAPGSGDDHPGP